MSLFVHLSFKNQSQFCYGNVIATEMYAPCKSTEQFHTNGISKNKSFEWTGTGLCKFRKGLKWFFEWILFSFYLCLLFNVWICVSVELAFDMPVTQLKLFSKKKKEQKWSKKCTFSKRLLALILTILTHFLRVVFFLSRFGSLLQCALISLLLLKLDSCFELKFTFNKVYTFIAAELCHKSCCCICNQAEKLVHLILLLCIRVIRVRLRTAFVCNAPIVHILYYDLQLVFKVCQVFVAIVCL